MKLERQNKGITKKVLIFFFLILCAFILFFAWNFSVDRGPLEIDNKKFTITEIVKPDVGFDTFIQPDSRRLVSNNDKRYGQPNQQISESNLDAIIPDKSMVQILEKESALEYIKDSATHFGWSKKQLASNLGLWNRPCKPAQELARVSEADLAIIGLTKEFSQNASEFSSFCNEIDLHSELESLDLLSAIWDESTELPTRTEQFSEELSTRNPVDEDLDEAISLIRDRIQAQDESSVTSLLALITQNNLYRSNNLSQIEFRFVSLSIVSDVAISLLCEYGDGCRGLNHPMVLRYCFQKYQFGQLCSNPNSIQDAIFQTTTPVSYYWYIQFYDYIRNELISNSR